MSNFKIGQKVVATVTFKGDENLGVRNPIKNEIYTIREIECEYLRFCEIINPVLRYKDGTKEVAYNPKRFRPLDHQFAEDVISYITELELTPQH